MKNSQVKPWFLNFVEEYRIFVTAKVSLRKSLHLFVIMNIGVMEAMEAINFTVNLGSLPLYTTRWKLDEGRKPKAVIQIVHSLSEHMGRYDEFAKYLNDYGYEVWGHDHPGHGQTGPELGSCSGDAMSLLLGGINAVREVIKQEVPDLPVILMGHSVGAFLSLRAAELNKNSWDAMILSGASDRNPVLLERAAIVSNSLLARFKKRRAAEKALFQVILKGFTSGTLMLEKTDWRTSDPEEVIRFYKDPHCGFPIDHDFKRSLVKGLSYWYRREELTKIDHNLPILIISGTEDRIGNYGRGAAKLAKNLADAGLSRIYLRFYEGARHDLLWEHSRQETMVDVLEFIKLAVKEHH